MSGYASARRTLAVAFCLTAVGCRHGVGAAAAESGYGSGAITLKVVNHSWLDVTIYVLQASHRDRIGTATAASTTQFHITLRQLSGGEYRLYGDPVGSRQTVRSEPVHPQDGGVVTWTLEDNLARSFIDVR